MQDKYPARIRCDYKRFIIIAPRNRPVGDTVSEELNTPLKLKDKIGLNKFHPTQIKLRCNSSEHYLHNSCFSPRDAMHKRGLCRQAVSLRLCACLSVCHVRGFCKRINLSSIFPHRYPHHSSFSTSNIITAIFGRRPPNGGVECRWGMQKSRFWANIWLNRVLRCQRCDQLGVINTVPPDRGKL